MQWGLLGLKMFSLEKSVHQVIFLGLYSTFEEEKLCLSSFLQDVVGLWLGAMLQHFARNCCLTFDIFRLARYLRLVSFIFLAWNLSFESFSMFSVCDDEFRLPCKIVGWKYCNRLLGGEMPVVRCCFTFLKHTYICLNFELYLYNP